MYEFIKTEHLSFRLRKIKGDPVELVPIALNVLSVIIAECDLNKNTTDEFVKQKIHKATTAARENAELTGEFKFNLELDYLNDLSQRLLHFVEKSF